MKMVLPGLVSWQQPFGQVVLSHTGGLQTPVLRLQMSGLVQGAQAAPLAPQLLSLWSL